MKVLLIILVIIILLLLIRVKLSASYDGKEFIAFARILFVRIQLFPGKSKSDEKEKAEEPKKEKQEKEDKGTNIKYIYELVKPILVKIRGRLSIDSLKVHFTAANEDAVATALIYGTACTVMGQIFPVLNGYFKIKKHDIMIEPNFTKKNCEITASMVISMAIWEIIYIGAVFLLHMLRTSSTEKVKMQEEEKEKKSKQIPIVEKGGA